jgi:hypothetical protein
LENSFKDAELFGLESAGLAIEDDTPLGVAVGEAARHDKNILNYRQSAGGLPGDRVIFRNLMGAASEIGRESAVFLANLAVLDTRIEGIRGARIWTPGCLAAIAQSVVAAISRPIGIAYADGFTPIRRRAGIRLCVTPSAANRRV